MSASVLAEPALVLTMVGIAELVGAQRPVDHSAPGCRELAHAGRRSVEHRGSSVTADLGAPLDIPITYPYSTHMTSGDPTANANAYAELAEAARAARARYDALLVDPAADPNDIEFAFAMAAEAEKARDRAGRQLARKQAPAQSAQRSVRQSGSREGQDDNGLSLPLRPAMSGNTEGFVTAGRQREQVADVLELLGAPARTPTVIAAVRHVHARELTAAQLVQLRREEQRQYRRAREEGGLATLRPWYLVPCLSADTLTAAAGTYALSTWPVVDRFITPYAPQLWVAHSVHNLSARLLRSPRQADGLNELLRTLLRGTSWGHNRHATDVHHSGDQSMGQWLQSVIADAAADAEHLQHQHQRAAIDAQDRLAALAERDPAVPLWGVPRPSEARREGDTI